MRFVAAADEEYYRTHGIDVWEPLGGLRRRALLHANLVLAPSRDTADTLRRNKGWRANGFAFCPGTRSAVRSADQPVASRATGGFSFWTRDPDSGTLAGDGTIQGMGHLDYGAARLLTRWPEVQLVLAGTGDDRGWLEISWKKNGVQPPRDSLPE